MGDTASNIRVIPHDRVGVGPIGFTLAKHFTQGGFPDWDEGPEITVAAYQAVHAAALQSQSAFDQAAATAWGPWFLSRFSTVAERAVLRARVMKVLP